ncbi:MAG: polysaccharide deacetylase family protein [Candidatus Acidiferrum sp.]|jgi:polysaccharide deacetylase
MRSKNTFCFLLATLALPASVASSRSDTQQQDAHLRAADVPVQPLRHSLVDPSTEFPESFAMQVAVFQTSEEGGMLGLVHALREMGIPFFVTRDLGQALRHRLVIVYPSADGRTFNGEQIHKLNVHVSDGGSLLSFNIVAGNLKPFFGFRDAVPSRRRHRVAFDMSSDPIEQYLNRPEEREVQLGSTQYDEIFWTNGYTSDGTSDVLARFDDGSAAVLRKNLGAGRAYLFGLSFQDVVLRNQANHDYDAERHYVNAFEPGSDVWMLMLRAWYESAQPHAVRLSTIPGAKKSVLLLSHDVDWENSFDPALDFVAMEAKHHVKSTFFIQTKYVSDANSASFFFGKDLADLKTLQSQGFSIGSHSVIHSRGFNKFELGTGTETFPAYQPRGTGFDSATGASVFGEIRVSKQLLDGELPGQQTVFFRAGHLRVPPTMPEALQRCGYLFDSSFTAPDVLTNFPYSLPLGLGFEEDSGILEFPLTFEDEEPPRLDLRVTSMLDVIRANSENEAISVILIHTNEAHYKLEAEEDLINQLPPGVTATDAVSFARFWRAREHLRWTVAPAEQGSTIRLTVTTEEPVEGLTFEFQQGVKSVAGNATLEESKHQIVLRPLKAGESISLEIRYSD